MKVTVWHENPREFYLRFDHVARVEHYDNPPRIALYSDTNLIASFGPGFSWAVEAEEEGS